MTLNVPLAVRLKTARADRHITHEVSGLRYRSAIPGGFASAQIRLSRPLSVQPDEVDYYANVYVYDARNGSTVWEGWVEDLGRSAARNGTVWEINAVGPSAHTRDRNTPLIYVDRNLLNWQDAEVAVAREGSVTLPADASFPSLHFQYGNGSAVATNTRRVMAYPLLRNAAWKLARFDYTWTSGSPSIDWRVQAVTRGGASGAATTRDNALNAASGGASPKVITTDFANDRDWLEVRMLWQGAAATVAGDTTWVEVADLCVMSTRYTATGTEITTGASYAANTVLSSEIVADLIGRLLPLYDGANAAITTGSFGINQLAYPDGAMPERVLSDLMDLESDRYWAAWESGSNGLYRFEWTTWPAAVRYEADVTDGFASPGSASDLYSAVLVRYRAANGQVLTVYRTNHVPALASRGGRDTIIDLGDEVGSQADAVQAGDQFLAQHAFPPNAGTLTVCRPIVDRFRNCMMQPWELRPGALIRVRGVLPRVDTLNATARDGATVFRVISVDFDSSTASAVLGLDSAAATTPHQVAELLARSRTRRR